MVTILFPSLISKVIKENRTEVIAETLGEVIDKLIEKYGKQFRETPTQRIVTSRKRVNVSTKKCNPYRGYEVCRDEKRPFRTGLVG